MSKKILDFSTISGESVKKYEGIKKYIATGDITNNKISSYTEVDYSNKPSRANQIAKIGEVLFAKMKDTIKVITINNKNSEYIYSTGFYIIKPKENVLTDYLYWLFNSPKFNIDKDKYCKGATQKALNNEGLSKIEIKELPNIEIQEKIVCKLNKVAEILNKKQEQLNALDELIKSQFVEMFLKNEFPKEKLENNVEEMFIGPFGSALKNECFVEKNNGYCVVYEQKHAIYKNIEDFRWVDKDKYESLKRFNVQPKDIIVSCRGTIGKTFVIPENAPLGIMHPSIMKIRLKKEKYIPEFFEMVLQHYFLEKENQTNGATIKMGIKASTIEKEEFIIPDMELQIKYLTFVKQIDKQKFEIENSLKEMQELYESLMEKYFG